MSRRLDPMAQAREGRKERRQQRRERRRLRDLENASLSASGGPGDPLDWTKVERLPALPDATDDIMDRLVLVQGTSERAILYLGTQLPDDSLVWVQWSSSYSDNPNSPEFTWSLNKSVGDQLRGVFHTSTQVFYSRSSQVARYTVPNGTATIVHADLPSGQSYGIYAESAGPSVWVAVQSVDKIEYYNGTTITSSAAVRDYWGVAFDVVGNRLLATDRANNRTLTINKTTLAIISTFATDCLTPEGIAADSSGNIYIADTGNNRIRKYNSSLAHQLNWGSFGTDDGQFDSPRGICVDGLDRVYVADSGNARIQVFSNTGVFLGKFGIGGSGNGEFSNPVGVSVNGTGIAVADAGNNRISYWTRT